MGEKVVGNGIYIIILLLSVISSIIIGTIWMDRLCVLVILMICFIFGKKEKNVVNPYYLFAITPFSLLIYIDQESDYTIVLTHSTWVLGIINMAAFVITLRLVPSYDNQLSAKSSGIGMSLFSHSVFLFSLSFVGRFIPSLSSVLWILSVPAIVCAIKSKQIKGIVLIIIYIFVSLSYGYISKLMLLILLMTLLISYDKYFAVTVKQKKMVILFAIIGLLFMIYAFSFANKERGYYDSEEGLEYYSNQGVTWEYDKDLFMPYMYITNGWTNLQFVTETQTSRTNGLWLIKPILGYLQMDDFYSNEYQLVPFSTFNTYGFITCGYKDFGYWFSVISAIFLGIFVKLIYSRFQVSKSPFDVGCYVLVGLATLQMFFSNHFFMQSYPFTIVIEMAIYKLFFKETFKKNISV